MSNYKISLHGGNYVSDSRKKAFQSALGDDHTIQIDNKNGSNGKLPPLDNTHENSSQNIETRPTTAGLPARDDVNSQGLKHSITHQNRTLDVHQQYLDQQHEYLGLIQDLIQQQGRIIDKSNPEEAEGLIRQLQQSLTALNTVQDRGLEIHQRFLDQQAKFSSDLVRLVQDSGSTRTEQNDLRPSTLPEIITPSSTQLKTENQIPDEKFSTGLKPEASTSLPQVERDTFSGTPPADLPNLPDEEDLSRALLDIVADKTGYPAEMLELEMDLEADLGVDSIKRVEILGSVEEMYPDLPNADTQILAETRTLQDIVEYFKSETGQEADTQSAGIELTSKLESPTSPQAQSQPEKQTADAGDLTAQLMAVVADKTGYPVEMLEPEMDMEADLGIDSIKRVEILGAMEDQHPDLPAIQTEMLAELRTLSEVIDFLTQETEAEVNQTPSEKKKLSSRVRIQEVKRIPLPDPDWLELEANQDKPLLFVSSAGTTAFAVLEAIHESNWPAIWIQIKTGNHAGGNYEQFQDLPTYHLESSGDKVIQDLILDIQAEHGNPAGVILNPESSRLMNSNGNQYDSIRTAFFFAKHLQPFLISHSTGERTYFMVVIKDKGQLGLGNSPGINPVLGLSGLVKTLHWEWPEVFTRLVDLDSDLGENLNGQYLLQEMHDPDSSLVEIGRSRNGRITLAPLAGRLS